MKLERLVSHWQQVRADLMATIDQFDEDELLYTPFDGSWPAGQVMLHIADAEEGWFRHVVTGELNAWPEDFKLEKYSTSESIKSLLTVVHDRTEAFLSSMNEEDLERTIETPWGKSISLGWIVLHVFEHEIHHRGELSLMLGLLGREGLDV